MAATGNVVAFLREAEVERSTCSSIALISILK